MSDRASRALDNLAKVEVTGAADAPPADEAVGIPVQRCNRTAMLDKAWLAGYTRYRPR